MDVCPDDQAITRHTAAAIESSAATEAAAVAADESAPNKHWQRHMKTRQPMPSNDLCHRMKHQADSHQLQHSRKGAQQFYIRHTSRHVLTVF